MSMLSALATEALVNALGWTLLHSLWQGALVALTLALLLVLLQRHAATTRYYLATGGMLLQLLFSGITFAHYYTSGSAEATTTQAAVQVLNYTDAAVIVPEATTVSIWQDPLVVAQAYFEQHLPLLVTCWLLGLVVMALRFMGALAYMQRLRFRSALLGDKWQEIKQHIAAQVGVRQAVQLAESAMVKVPMVIGFAKPVILLPIGAVAGLSTAQVEAILAHELAHIRRNDYLVNLVQSMVDILFFYHPAMWWMSGAVRDERENCCDDMAVAVCGNSLVYARALATIAEMQVPKTPALAVALAGRKGSLLGRIRRLVAQPSLRPTFSEGFMAALVVVVGVLLLSVGAMASMKDKSETKKNKAFFINETIVEKKAAAILPEYITEENLTAYTFTTQDTAGRKQDIVIIKNKKGEVSELYVNGRQIPKKDIPAYNDLINQRLEAIKNAPKANRVEVEREIRREREAVAEARRDRGKKREEYHYEYRFGDDESGAALMPPPPPAPPAPAPHPSPRVPMAPMVPVVPPIPPVPPVAPLDLDGNNKADAKKQQKAYEKAMKDYEKEMKAFQEDMKVFEEDRRQYVRELETHAGERAQANKQRLEQRHEASMRRHAESMKRHEQSMRRHEESMKRHDELAGMLDNVSEELVKDGLLNRNADKVDFKIDDKGMYIDGKKQPQEVYNKYRSLMKTKEGKPLNYTYKKDGKSKSININQ